MLEIKNLSQKEMSFNMSYHGKTPEQARWVLENFATPEVREMHKNNRSFNEWLEQCHQILEAERLNY
jgi:hypothetical protein